MFINKQKSKKIVDESAVIQEPYNVPYMSEVSDILPYLADVNSAARCRSCINE